MSKYENLNVYKEVYNLSVGLFSDISKFDRNYKFTLWDKITNTIIETLELIININNLDISERKQKFKHLMTYDSTINRINRDSAILHPLCRNGRKSFGNILQSKKAVSVSNCIGINRFSDDDLPAWIDNW